LGDTVTFSGNTYITTTYATATNTLSIDHDATTRNDTASSDSPGVGGNFTAVDSVTTNSTGHVTGLNLKTVTLPDDGIDGSGTLNYVAKFTPDGDTIGNSQIFDNGTNVGIGTSSVDERLHVEGSVNNDDVAIKIENTFDDNNPSSAPTAALVFTAASTNGYMRVHGAPADTAAKHQIDIGSTASSSYLTFSPSTTEKMRITSSGNVGIATTNPASKLQVNTGTDINAQIGLDSFGSFKLGDISNNYSGRGIYYDGTPSSEDLDVFTSTFNIAGNSGEGIKNVSSGDVQLSSPFGVVLTINGTTSNVGIGTASPSSKLQVDGAVQVADDTDTASADKVGALRYRTSGNNSYVDMCMQTGASTYAWVNIVQNNW
jgi:hypothetical protein